MQFIMVKPGSAAQYVPAAECQRVEVLQVRRASAWVLITPAEQFDQTEAGLLSEHL